MSLPHPISLRPLPPLDMVHLSDSPQHQEPPLSPQSIDHSSAAISKQASSTAVEPNRSYDRLDDPLRSRNTPQPALDVETGTHDIADDPYSLSKKIMSPADITNIRQKIAHTPTPNHSSKRLHARKVQKYYEDQNENIERLLKPVSEHVREARSESEAEAFQYKVAVTGSFVANVALAVLQVYAAASSGSLSIITTMADALFDPLSNITLIACNRAVKKVDGRKYPSGKARIETAGNIVFCSLMCAVSFIIIVLSARDLAAGSNGQQTLGFHLVSVIIVGIAFVTKLSLFLYCWGLRHKYSQIYILWEDHRNDLFINGFGLLTAVGGAKLKWWIDPMGAIILSTLIVILWGRTAFSEFNLLIGVTADTHTQQLITYISMTHSKDILAIDTVRAWHSGPRLIVEVDIVMNADDTLRKTHDVAEDLQMKLESLPNVDRAYVHVDFETSHAPEHFLKKEL